MLGEGHGLNVRDAWRRLLGCGDPLLQTLDTVAVLCTAYPRSQVALCLPSTAQW